MTLNRGEIDILIGSLEAESWRRFHVGRDDPELLHDIVGRTRALLRVSHIELHMYICDQTQRLLYSLGQAARKGEGETVAVTAGRVPTVDANNEAKPDWVRNLVADQFEMNIYDLVRAGEACDAVADKTADKAAGNGVAQSGRDAGTVGSVQEGERRHRKGKPGVYALHEGLSSKQLATLETMEYFGWTLEFVRRPLFHPPIPVAFDRNQKSYAAIEVDGSFREDANFRIRD